MTQTHGDQAAVPPWRHLPHVDASNLYQFVTFRLADSLPSAVLHELERELAATPQANRDRVRSRRIERWLDAGLGSCALRHPAMARVMRDTLHRFDGERYRLHAWCVMPNHVHVLINTITSLPRSVQAWKSFTGRWAWRHWVELGLDPPSGRRAFWMRDYWDRFIRDERHFLAATEYIHDNPVKAGLCRHAREWPWSSATGLLAGDLEDAELGLGAPSDSVGSTQTPRP